MNTLQEKAKQLTARAPCLYHMVLDILTHEGDDETLQCRINKMVSMAILDGKAKPARKKWTPEQREEGKAKLKLMEELR